MFAKNFFKIFILTTTAALLLNQHAAQASPMLAEQQNRQVPNLKDDIAKENAQELNELNKTTKYLNENDNSASSSEQLAEDSSSSEEAGFAHHDEDLPRTAINLNMEQSLKYDVEVLESRDVQKENIELEERFRGPAIKMNTDTFVAENIEVNGDDDDMNNVTDDDIARVQRNHVLLSIILVIVAIVSIGLYAALVIWRSNLEQRYGMRELLVSTDDDFHQFSSNCNNNNNHNNNNHHFNSGDSNTRHFALGQA